MTQRPLVRDQFLDGCAAGIKDGMISDKNEEGKDIWVMVSSAPRYDEKADSAGLC